MCDYADEYDEFLKSEHLMVIEMKENMDIYRPCYIHIAVKWFTADSFSENVVNM